MSPSARKRRRRVLVADPNRFFRELVVSLVDSLGHEAVGVAGAGEASQALGAGAWEVVVLDASLAGGGAGGVLAALAARSPRPTCVVLSRGDADEAGLAPLRTLGVTAAVAKTAPIDELRQAVEAALFPRERNARRSPRARVQIPVGCTLGAQALSTQSFNLSADGMFVVTTEVPPAQPGTVLGLTFWVPGADALIRVSSVVIWVNDGGRVNELYPPGMGVMFQGLTRGDAKAISSYLDGLGAERV